MDHLGMDIPLADFSLHDVPAELAAVDERRAAQDMYRSNRSLIERRALASIFGLTEKQRRAYFFAKDFPAFPRNEAARLLGVSPRAMRRLRAQAAQSIDAIKTVVGVAHGDPAAVEPYLRSITIEPNVKSKPNSRMVA